MGKLVQAVGGLLALGLAAEFFMGTGHDRDYAFTLRTIDGRLVVDKDNTSGVYVLSLGYKTRFNFTNQTTNPAADVNVKIFEPKPCHVDFKKGTGCVSDELTIAPTKKDKIHAEKDTADGYCKPGDECPFNSFFIIPPVFCRGALRCPEA